MGEAGEGDPVCRNVVVGDPVRVDEKNGPGRAAGRGAIDEERQVGRKSAHDPGVILGGFFRGDDQGFRRRRAEPGEKRPGGKGSGGVVTSGEIPDADDSDPGGLPDLPVQDKIPTFHGLILGFPAPLRKTPQRRARTLSSAGTGAQAFGSAAGGAVAGAAALGLRTARTKTQSAFNLWRSSVAIS